jgi:fucose permease
MTSTVRAGTQGRSRFLVAVVFFVFFLISFLTNILGPLVPDIIADFNQGARTELRSSVIDA